MKNKKTAKVPRTFQLSPSDIAKIERLAAANKTTRNQIVKTAINVLYDKNGEEKVKI